MSDLALCARCMKAKPLRVGILGPFAYVWCEDCWKAVGAELAVRRTLCDSLFHPRPGVPSVRCSRDQGHPGEHMGENGTEEFVW